MSCVYGFALYYKQVLLVWLHGKQDSYRLTLLRSSKNVTDANYNYNLSLPGGGGVKFLVYQDR